MVWGEAAYGPTFLGSLTSSYTWNRRKQGACELSWKVSVADRSQRIRMRMTPGISRQAARRGFVSIRRG
jgi:hypothetical protein